MVLLPAFQASINTAHLSLANFAEASFTNENDEVIMMCAKKT